MKIHYLQHVPFEGLANIEPWALTNGHAISKTLLFNNEKLPKMDDFDWLIVMGGPMNIYEDQKYPWLKKEKKFIEKTINNQKKVLGICLGAQLIADVLGAKVTRNKHKEIGWYPINLTGESKKSSIFAGLPDEFIAFHWHGDTFGIPGDAVRIAESKGSENQAFEYNGKVIGLQFHVESSFESINNLISNCKDDFNEGSNLYMQSPMEILSKINNLLAIEKTMKLLLNAIEKE